MVLALTDYNPPNGAPNGGYQAMLGEAHDSFGNDHNFGTDNYESSTLVDGSGTDMEVAWANSNTEVFWWRLHGRSFHQPSRSRRRQLPGRVARRPLRADVRASLQDQLGLWSGGFYLRGRWSHMPRGWWARMRAAPWLPGPEHAVLK
jgi:hypothetical protein